MALKFLNKKKFNPANINNVEKVWIAEQKAADEDKKLVELQKQIHEERQMQELRHLQVASGQAVKTVDTTMDWMYEGPAGSSLQQQASEEYLLGKIFKSKSNAPTDLHQVGNQAGALWLSKVNSKNDTFSRIHEDPMLKIREQEKLAREKILNNPYKMSKLKNEIFAKLHKSIAEDENRSERPKKSKKDKKDNRDEKEKKRASKDKKKKKEEEEEEEEDSSESEDRKSAPKQRKRSRSDSMDSAREKSSSKGGSRFDDKSASRHGRSRSRSRERIEIRRRDREDLESPPRRRATSLSSHGDRCDNREKTHDRDRRDERDGRGTRDFRDGAKDRESYGGTSKYGLQGGTSSADNKDFLGPRPDLLARKAEDLRKEEEARRNRVRESVRELSEEERLRRIKEMEEDARMHDTQRLMHSIPSLKSAVASISNPVAEDNNNNTGGASFLRSMRSEVYTSSAISMEERLQQNRHYQQKGLDNDTSGFMKR